MSSISRPSSFLRFSSITKRNRRTKKILCFSRFVLIPVILLFLLAVRSRSFMDAEDQVWINTHGCTGYGRPLETKSPWRRDRIYRKSVGVHSGFCACSADEISIPQGCLHLPLMCSQVCASGEVKIRGSPRTACVKWKKKKIPSRKFFLFL